jgi:PhnB protein
MPKRPLFEQLDQAVEAVLARRGAVLPPADAKLAGMVRLAAELRDLPSEDFKARLHAELMNPGLTEKRRESMSTGAKSIQQQATMAVKPIREGFHTVTPYLAVQKATQLIDFVKQAFGAVELFRAATPGGGLHAEVRIGDSMVMIGGSEGMPFPETPAVLHLYVSDADAVYKRALQAGASSMAEPVDQDYGDREAGVKDIAGNQWYIATHKGAGYIPEGLRSLTPYLHVRGAARMIDFLKQALGAEEAFRAQSPDGVIQHAKIRIGDSMVEMGEAHGEYQPRPAMFYLYVDDVDALYQRAVQAGATAMEGPADQPYGDRTAHVKDPSGNSWYIATHI